jgi:transglutaminase-like putative cysteine protease
MLSCRRVAALARIALLAVVLLAPARVAAGPDYERWYTVDMVGQRAGWMMSSQTTANGTITNRSEMSLSIRRGPIEVTIGLESEFVETTDHKPVSMKTIQRTGAVPVEQVYTFGPKGLTVQTTQGNQEKVTSELPLPEGEWLTPAAAGDFVDARLKAGDQRISVQTIDPLAGASPIEVTREVLGRTNILAGGASIPTTKCKVTQSVAMGVASTDYIDAGGIPVRVETKMGIIELAMQATTKEEAMAETRAPEIMVSTFVKPDQRIARPRYKKHGVYTLSVSEGALPDLPHSGAQRVERIDERTAKVIVDVLEPLPAADADHEAAEYLESSSMLSTGDAEVAAMAAAAVREAGPTPAARAEAIRRFVHGAISTKSLDVGFATASETARTREGDCSEHAVLLAALLRASGIPARVASGLVYADSFAGEQNIFGYHMWSQALLEQDGQWRWIDLDATLGETTFDATHIALSVSALSDGQTYEAMVPMATLIGQLSIRVDSAE